MPTELDSKLPPIIKANIDRFGRDATLSVVTQGKYDPTLGKVAGSITTDYTVKATPPAPHRTRYVESSKTKATVSYIYPSTQFTPTVGMSFTFGTDRFTVTELESVYSGELVAVYGLILTKEG